MADKIIPPDCAPDDEENTPVNVEALSDADLGAVIRKELRKRNARFVKTFRARTEAGVALFITLVRKP